MSRKEVHQSASTPQVIYSPYRDFSRVIESPEESAIAQSAPRSSDHYFPVKLHYVLSMLETDGLAHIASWAPHGRCFKVHNTDEFVEKVLAQ
jgi:hypothetical protein